MARINKIGEIEERHIWASELGGCPYKAWLKLQGVEGGYKPPSTLWWLSVGKGMEEDVLNQLIQHPDSPIVDYDSQQEYLKYNLYSDIFITGKVDAIGYDEEENPYIVEVKTMGRKVFEKFLKRGMGAVKYYMPQIQFYMYMTGIHKAILVARDRDSFMEFYTTVAPQPMNDWQYRIHWQIVEYDEAYIEKILYEWGVLFKEAELGDTEHLKKPSGLCFFCEYKDICKPPIRKLYERREDISDAFLDDMFDAYLTAKDWLEEFVKDYPVGTHITTDNYTYEVREYNGWKYLTRLEDNRE